MQSASQELKSAANPALVGNYPIQPLRALRAMGHLLENKEDTAQVFEIVEAFSGGAIKRDYQRLLCTPEGARQAYRAEEIAAKLQDQEWLACFAPGTVGAHYREFVRMRNLSAYGLALESRKVSNQDMESAHPIAWYARRLRDVHDVWHVLTGYGTDVLGEGCVLAFTYAQIRNPGAAFIAAVGAFELTRAHWRQPYARAIFEGYRRGRKAEWLPALDYECLFAEPLEVARKGLKIMPPVIYQSIPVEARSAYLFPDDRELRLASR